MSDSASSTSISHTPLQRQRQQRSDGVDESWVDRAIEHLRQHRLPPWLEVIVAWWVATGCLGYYGYSYLRGCRQSSKPAPRVPLVATVRRRRAVSNNSKINNNNAVHDLYREIQRIAEQKMKEEYADNNEIDSKERLASVIVHCIRHDVKLRRLISDFMTALDQQKQLVLDDDDDRLLLGKSSSDSSEELSGSTASPPVNDAANNIPSEDWQKMKDLYQLLDRVWVDLLRFPSIDDGWDRRATIFGGVEISLILPAYRESAANLQNTLRRAWQTCIHPAKVQVIVVDAGHCADNLQEVLQESMKAAASARGAAKQQWGDCCVVTYRGNGGRGPCQNFGAEHAKGRLLTFLHSDTLLPPEWDSKVRRTLLPPFKQQQQQQSSSSQTPTTITTQGCAFAFGHDTKNLNGMGYPWGIRSVWFLGNIRAYLFSLPYGDHIISIPASHFRYVGGFPDQPIMEDYELMDLFRQRAKISELQETLRIIAPPTGRCSVRRWQRFGVVYVTLVNALVVHRYSAGVWDADDVFDYYYRRPYETKKPKLG